MKTLRLQVELVVALLENLLTEAEGASGPRSL